MTLKNRYEVVTMKSNGDDDLLGPRELIAQVPIEQREVMIPGGAGYPWSVSQFDLVEHDSRQGKDFLPEEGTRTWSVEYILAKNVELADEGGSLSQSEIGSSHLALERDTEIKTRADGSSEAISIRLLRAPDGTLGKIIVPVETDHPIKARVIAGRVVSGLLGALSFLGNIPLYLCREIVRDPKSGWARFWVVLPAPPPTLGRVKLRIHSELRPVLALWRESRNSRSYFYRFLCLFKIIEGLLEHILPRVFQELTKVGKEFECSSHRVPDEEEIKGATPEFVGRKFTWVRDKLKGQYRHALAHFGIDDEQPLNIDEPSSRHEYERLFPVVDHMARTLISEAERLLALRG
jgi:hypothetical protein